MAFFLQCGGKLNGKVSDAKYRRSPIAEGGDRMKIIVELNYNDYFLPGSYAINELKRNMNVGEEGLHIEEDEDDHIIDTTRTTMLHV